MDQISFQDNLHGHAQWRRNIQQSLERYHAWLKKYGLNDAAGVNALLGIIHSLATDRITLAFVAEFSRGKTELINALFFGENGVRLLPSAPGRTTMCPTELFYDEKAGSYIRLLEIESRREESPLIALKQNTERWKHIALDPNSPEQMQSAFQELAAVKTVSKDEAIALGLYDEQMAADLKIHQEDKLEIPRWRHALVSFPHPLLKEGLTILDTPGLNALGSEPELTLNMLPNAQAIVFIIAADTGVTKSDMDMWNQHVRKSIQTKKQGLAVVMNKIDDMWDDLTSEAEYREAVESQLSSTAKTLKIGEKVIFPVSAKHGLIAKIKNDAALLKRSQISAIEQYLSDEIVEQRQKLVVDKTNQEVKALLTQSLTAINREYAEATRQFEELKQFDADNTGMVESLLADTQRQQEIYFELLAEFKHSRALFHDRYKALLDSLSPSRIEYLMRTSKQAIGKSLTTEGMKIGIQGLFTDLRKILEHCIDNALTSQSVTKSIYQKLHANYGFCGILPQQFRIEPYQSALEKLFGEGEEYCRSAKLVATEQSKVVRKLYETLMGRIYDVFLAAYNDAEACGRHHMPPLMEKVTADKKHIESRLAVLHSSMKSKENLGQNLENLDKQIVAMAERRNELDTILKALASEGLVIN